MVQSYHDGTQAFTISQYKMVSSTKKQKIERYIILRSLSFAYGKEKEF